MRELSEQRDKEIEKRKFSYYNQSPKEQVKEDNTKYFFDENVIEKLSSSDEKEKVIQNNKKEKKKLEKKITKLEENSFESKQNRRNIMTAFNAQPIIQLEEKTFTEKTEIFSFKSSQLDLDTSQKIKISEYVGQVINKPIKIEIKLNSSQKNKTAKSRSLLIRAFLVKLGISHNRINIEFDEKYSDINKNEIAISFIEI